MMRIETATPSAPLPGARPFAPPAFARSRLVTNNRLWRLRQVREASVEGLPVAFLGMAYGVDDVGFARVLIEGTVGGRPFSAVTPHAFVEPILARLAPQRPSDMPGAAAACLLELAFADVLTACERLGGAPISLARLVHLGTDPPPRRDRAPLGCRMRIQGIDMAGLLYLCDRGEDVLAAILDGVPPASSYPTGLALPLAIEVGQLRVAPPEAAALEPGDLLLPEGCHLARSTALVVLADRLAALGAVEGPAIRITQPMMPRTRLLNAGDTTMEDAINPAPPDAARIGDVDVRLTFEIGRLAMPLAELGSLAPGCILDLGREPAEAVDVVANGLRIGRGEIVTAGDRLAVRLIQVFRNG